MEQLTYDQIPVILIEFRDGKISNLVNSKGELFCFDWSKKLEIYLVPSEDSDTIDGECWVSEMHESIIKDSFPNIKKIELPSSIGSIQKDLDTSYMCEGTIYCKVCESSYDRDDFYHKHGGDYCVHINWSEEAGEFAGCGYSEDNWEDYKKPFLSLLDAIAPDVPALKHSLEIHQYYFTTKKEDGEYSVSAALVNPPQSSIKDEWRHQGRMRSDRCWRDLHRIPDAEKAIMWIDSLWSVDICGDACSEVPTTLADETTVKWIEEWESLRKVSN